MSASALAAAGVAATLGTMSVPLAVAAIVAPVNRHRDGRRNAAETAHADEHTATLVAQIRAGADHAALINLDPGKLASAAYGATAGLAAWIATEGHPDDVPLARRVLDVLAPILTAERQDVPPAEVLPPLAAAVALHLLLHRLSEAYDGLLQVRVSIAAGAAAEVVRALPDGASIDFNPLREFDPVPLRRAQAEWVTVAQHAGMSGWVRAVHV